MTGTQEPDMQSPATATDLKSRIRIWDFKASPVEDFDVQIDEGGWEVSFFAHNYLCRHIVSPERAENGDPIWLKCIGKGLAAEIHVTNDADEENDIKMKPKETNSGDDPKLDVTHSVPDSEKLADGQHKDHWVLPKEERDKGFIRPVRRSYIHDACGVKTSMPQAIAETYARDPGYYGQTFCCGCGGYFPVGEAGELKWEDGTRVGT